MAVGTNSNMTLKPSNLGYTMQNWIGRSQFADPLFQGRVDEFHIFNRPLTVAEIQALMGSVIPPVPTNLSASPGVSNVTLNWAVSAGATTYNVKRSMISGGPYSTIGSSSASTYTDTSAVNGTTYYYVLSAMNAVGESSNSAEVSAKPGEFIAYWKFDETSGTTAADSSGNGNNAILQSGATWTTGKSNNAVSLNGTGYVLFPAGFISTLDDFSISTWVYVNANGTWARVFDFGTGTGTYMFLTPASGGSTVRYAITISGNGAEQRINSGAVLSPGAWHHLAVTLLGTTGTLYIDGVPAGSNTSMTLKPSRLGNTAQNYIGRSQWPDPYLNGLVDDFRIYRRALTAAEVSTLFSSGGGVPAPPANLTANPASGLIGLNWDASAAATLYKVKRSTTNGGPYSTITNVPTTNWTDTVVLNGTRYYYVVSAANISGEGSNSAPASATPSSTAPINAVMSVSRSMLNISWPSDHIGWRLQAQTNSLGTNWFDVPNSTTTNFMMLPINSESPLNVFFRLIYP